MGVYTKVGVIVGKSVGVRVGTGVFVNVIVAVGIMVGVDVYMGNGDGVLDGVGVFVAVAVLVGVGAGKLFKAAAALTIPLPQMDTLHPLPPGNGRAVSCKLCKLWV